MILNMICNMNLFIKTYHYFEMVENKMLIHDIINSCILTNN